MLFKPPKNQIDEKTGKLIFAPDHKEWTLKEKKQYEFYEKFKANEYEIYKTFHSAVLNDDGNPKLKKTGFKIPGYRTVLGQKLDEYEIDNDILYKRLGQNTSQQDVEFANVIVPEEAVESGQSFNVFNGDESDRISKDSRFEHLAQERFQAEQARRLNKMLQEGKNPRPASPYLKHLIK